MLGGGSFSTGHKSTAGQTRRGPTGPGGKARFAPLDGGGIRTQLHCYLPLHWGGSPSCTTVESGEGGGAHRPASGSKRCRPRPGELLMHLWEERNWSRVQREPPRENHRPTSRALDMVEVSTRVYPLATRASIAIVSGSDSGIATVLEALRCSD